MPLARIHIMSNHEPIRGLNSNKTHLMTRLTLKLSDGDLQDLC